MILISISTLALAESGQAIDANYKAYTLKFGEYKITVVSPLDAKRSVLVGVRQKGQKTRDSYLVEGVVALAVSRLAKLAFSVDSSQGASNYSKKMVEARALTMKIARE
jgi:hypothetical protein